MIPDKIGSDWRRWCMASFMLKQSYARVRHTHCTGMRTILVLAAGCTLLGQDLPAPIKVDVSVVSVLASVRDKRGALVSNLEKQDFTILEDGKPQEIKYFTKETDLPLTIGLLVDVSGSQRNLIEIRSEERRVGK